MAEGLQVFEFTTKAIPQVKGADGAHWEKIPLASFPPVFDISIPDSTANAVAASMSNIADSFNGLNNTLQAVTQNLQTAACSVGDIVDSLKSAQLFADQFANANNNTTIYARQIGLDPVGVVNSQQAFVGKVRAILNDTGTQPGQLPKLVPAEIVLDPTIIANALGSGQTLLDNAIGGITQLGGTAGQALDSLGVSASAGLGLKKLSNDINFQPTSKGGGFSASTITYSVLSIIKIDASLAEITIETKSNTPSAFSIQGSVNQPNNGSFSAQQTQQISSLGKTFTRLRYQNARAVVETTSQAKVVFQGVDRVKAAETIRSALEQEGLFGPNVPRKTIPAPDLLDILVKYNIIGVNPDQVDSDRSIALERLVRITGANNARIGGVLLVGRAPNLPALARKVQGLSQMIEWLKPLADKLAFTALAGASNNASGIDFDPTTVSLSKLKTASNVGKKDAEVVKKKIEDSGVLNHQLIPFDKCPEPSKTNFNLWQCFKPVQLIPGLETLGEFQTGVQSPVVAAINATTGGLAELIQNGKDSVQTGAQKLSAQGNAIDSITAEMNALNDRMVSGLNFIKNQIGVGPISLEGHFIGAKLTLQSNEQYVESVVSALNDVTDPNRPTFGPTPTTSVLENQNTLKAALQGSTSVVGSTKLWFGLVLICVGEDRKQLGEQLRTLADILSMDSSVIDLPPKKKLFDKI